MWFDPDILRLNYDGRGDYLGEFGPSDLVLVILTNGEYYTSTFDAANHYEDNILRIERFVPEKVWSAVVFDADQGYPLPQALHLRALGPQAAHHRRKPRQHTHPALRRSRRTLSRGLHHARGRSGRTRASSGGGLRIYRRQVVQSQGQAPHQLPYDNIEEIEPIEIIDNLDSDSEGETPATDDADTAVAPDFTERSDEEVRDEITGQQRIF